MTHPKCIQYFRKRVYKEEIKNFVDKLREIRTSILQERNTPTSRMSKFEISLLYSRANRISNSIRHYHIAASLLRGKTREQIERPRGNNLPDESYIKLLYDEGEELAQKQYKEYLEAI